MASMIRLASTTARRALPSSARSMSAVPSATAEFDAMDFQTQLYINGEFVDAKTGAKFPTVNPVTEEVITYVQEAGAEDVDAAVPAARAALPAWKRVDAADKRDMLLKLADLLEEAAPELAKLESLDNGKPEHIARDVDIAQCVNNYRYFAGWADKITGKTIPTTQGTADTFAFTTREPVGVVGAVIPWNFPLLMQCWKLAPALAAGNTVVMKLSEKTPLSGMKFMELVEEAGFPAGVVNMLNGPGATGEVLARHGDVDKIAFTGSSAVGHKIASAASETNLKRCCVASSRIYVHEDVHDEFVEKIVALASRLRSQGDLTSETDVEILDLGPQVDKTQFDKIMAYIEAGKAEGAKCEIGGKRLGETGYYVAPTIFSNVTDDMTIAREEIFGPVMQLLKYSDLDDAIARANDTQYGLAAGVCTRDAGTAMYAAKELQAGTVWVNCYDNFDVAMPFGGYKESGWGRDKGEYALDNYSETKAIMMPIDRKA
ncbi:aldehyde dehydrogenase [Aureococcus anophagefferens]|nr:aldehyde dehydrogenase [Aureococcus anophagefferens]